MGQRGAVGIIKDKCRIRMNQYHMPTKGINTQEMQFHRICRKAFTVSNQGLLLEEQGNSHSHDSCRRSRVNIEFSFKKNKNKKGFKSNTGLLIPRNYQFERYKFISDNSIYLGIT